MTEERTLTVTKARVFPFKVTPAMGHLRGFAQVELEGAIVMRGLRIMEGETPDDLRVTMPLDPFYKGEDFKAVIDLNEGTGKAVTEAVLAKYREFLAQEG